MKKIIATLILASAVAAAEGQTSEDALRISQDKPSGTARSMALSGAMGALGGDFTSIGINPAGIAVYRSSEFTFTPSLQYTKTESDYFGSISTDDKFSLPFQQIGFVGTYRPIHEVSSGLISTHFGIGYSRNNSFSRRSFIQGNGIQSSLLDMFVDQANAGIWDDFYNGLAYDHFLIDEHPEEGYSGHIHGFEYVGENPDNIFWGPTNGINQSRILTERGSAGDFNLSFGANFSHKLYVGATLGIATFNFDKTLSHYEEVNGGWQSYSYNYLYFRAFDGFEGRDDFEFREKIKTTGAGINLKTGIIYKPTNELRLGLAFHSPTFYSFDDEFTTMVESQYFDIELENNEPVVYDGGIDKGRRYGEFSYNFRTPLKAIGSLSYIFGTSGLISMDYEYTDYSSMEFKSKNSTLSDIQSVNARNSAINNTFRATHNLRFGAEYRPTELFSLRAGYGVFQSPYKEGHFKNKDKHQTYSAGFGFRMDNMFVDFGYMLRQEKEAYSLYYASHLNDEDQLPAQLKTNRHNFGVTLGWRF